MFLHNRTVQAFEACKLFPYHTPPPGLEGLALTSPIDRSNSIGRKGRNLHGTDSEMGKIRLLARDSRITLFF